MGSPPQQLHRPRTKLLAFLALAVAAVAALRWPGTTAPAPAAPASGWATGQVGQDPDRAPASGPFTAPPKARSVVPSPLCRPGAADALVRGRVHARLPGATALSVQALPLEPEHHAAVRTSPVDAAGAFHIGGLAPGRYRVAMERRGRAQPGLRPDERGNGVPLLDDGCDGRATAEITLRAGEIEDLELREPPLGVLEGRVTLGGRPAPGVIVVGVRPGGPRGEFDDWDSAAHIGGTAGQHTAADGTFRFLYRDVGPCELRVRHPGAAATAPPVVVDLPPPGPPVWCELQCPTGAVRGRFAVARLEAAERRDVEAHLFPLALAAEDPYESVPGSLHPPLCDSRAAVPLTVARDEFEFRFVPAGEWVLRVRACGDRLLAERSVTVGNGAVDLGELERRRGAGGRLVWVHDHDVPCPDGAIVHRSHGDEARAIWVGWAAGSDGTLSLTDLPAGRYTVTPAVRRPFDIPPMGATAVMHGFAVELAGDGSVSPRFVRLQPLPGVRRR